jgi:hypothetical protein
VEGSDLVVRAEGQVHDERLAVHPPMIGLATSTDGDAELLAAPHAAQPGVGCGTREVPEPRVRLQVGRAVRGKREQERVVVELLVKRGRSGLAPASVLGEHLDGLRIQRDAAVLVGLGVLLPRLPAALPDAAVQRQHPGVQVDVAPPDAHSSPRRTPVTIASQTSAPQSGSDHASARIRAASCAVGGCGLGFGAAGGSACMIGFVESQRPIVARVRTMFDSTRHCEDRNR